MYSRFKISITCISIKMPSITIMKESGQFDQQHGRRLNVTPAKIVLLMAITLPQKKANHFLTLRFIRYSLKWCKKLSTYFVKNISIIPQINVTVEIVVYDYEPLHSDTTLGILQYNYIGPKVQNKSITTLPGRKQLEWVEKFYDSFNQFI